MSMQAAYLAKCADTSEVFSALMQWRTNAQEIPSWAGAARKALLVQPSSVASERGFHCMLKASFNEQQDLSLKDYIETSVMYNSVLLVIVRLVFIHTELSKIFRGKI